MPDYLQIMPSPLGKRILLARTAKGWDQAELAFRAEVSTGFISQVETGRRNPSIVTLRKIAEALSVSTGDLIEEDSGPGRMDWLPVVERSSGSGQIDLPTQISEEEKPKVHQLIHGIASIPPKERKLLWEILFRILKQ